MGRKGARAQFQHIFTFLMIGVLALFILLIGWRFINGMFTDACQLQERDFLDQLDEALTNFISYGAVKTLSLPPPCDVEKLCFVDARTFTAHGNPFMEPYTINVQNPTLPCRGGGDTSTIKPYNTADAFLRPPNPPRNKRIENSIISPGTPPTNLFFITREGDTKPLQYYAGTVQLEDFCSALCIEPRGGLFRFQLHGFGKHVVITEVT
ncbi:hypothetical protein D6789_04465 [Candidatus Woesearchaeota archaeon]|nr:MAG: hypothetical protein D6789_04465 [Candidatus Woesearchaeota archaeon]